MAQLRGFLRVCFGYLTLIFIIVSGFSLTTLFRVSHAHPWGLSSFEAGRTPLASILLGAFVRCFPLLLAITYGMAWWTLKQSKPSARLWSVAASALMVITSATFMAMRLYSLTHGRGHFRGSFLFFQGFFVATGILGIVVFSRSSADSLKAKPRPPRIRGDGTSSFLDALVWVFGLVGVWGGMILYLRWGYSQHLPMLRGSLNWVVIIAIILFVTLLHESAHAAIGLAVGMKLRAFIIGPFQWRIRDGRWTFRFKITSFLALGGATGIVPSTPNQSRWNELCMIAGGPLVNLFTGLLSLAAALSAKGRPWQSLWEILAFFATVSIVTFAVNLVPFRPEAAYSDGARIYQLLRGGPWTDLHRTFSMVLSSTVTPLRPRNYEMETIAKASAFFTHGREAIMLRLFAASHYLDCGEMERARIFFLEAEKLYRDSNLNLAGELLTTFVFDSVVLCHDAAGARAWWDLMESKSPSHFGVDYWLSRSALHWIENQPMESLDAWQNGNALVTNLPDAGAYNFDKDRYALLRGLLNTAPPARPPAIAHHSAPALPLELLPVPAE